MSLADIAAEAAKDEKLQPAPQAGEPGAPAPAPQLDAAALLEAQAKGWAGFPYVLGGLCAKAMPGLIPVYTETACLEWGRAMALVAQKYGWTVGPFGPWFGLTAASWS